MNKDQFVVIMAGGIGSRFWPFSRSSYPKQFQDILGVGKTLLQQTAERFDSICPPENIYVVTSEDYYELVKENLPYLQDEQILLEPFRRNTAPCVAYAAYKIYQKNPKANLVVAPADHVILDTPAFLEKLNIALEFTAQTENVVTLGIEPTRPDTGYGYIQISEKQREQEVKLVQTFTEKPNLETAQMFVESGDFLWNAGIFIWSAQTVMTGFEKYQPAIAEAFEEIKNTFYTNSEKMAIHQVYSQCHPVSVDNGIMEKARDVYVIPCTCGWSDLGTWKSLYEVSEKDENQNVLDGNFLLFDTKNSIIKTPKERLVVAQGLENYIVAEYDNVLLICQKDQEQKIKQFLEQAKKKKGKEFG